MPRPRGSKTRPPVKADEATVLSFLEKRDQSEGRKFKDITLSQLDREYLLNMLEVFRKRIDPTISMYDPEHVTNTFKYNPRRLFDNIMSYFEVSIRYGAPLTLSGITSLNQMGHGALLVDNLNKLPEGFSFLKECVDFVEFYMEYTGQKKQNPAFQIFWLKNRGWKDKFEIEASSTIGAMTDEEREKAQKRLAAFSEERIIEIKKLEEKTAEKINSSS